MPRRDPELCNPLQIPLLGAAAWAQFGPEGTGYRQRAAWRREPTCAARFALAGGDLARLAAALAIRATASSSVRPADHGWRVLRCPAISTPAPSVWTGGFQSSRSGSDMSVCSCRLVGRQCTWGWIMANATGPSRDYQLSGCCLSALLGLVLVGGAVCLLVAAAFAPEPFWRPLEIELGSAVLLFAFILPAIRKARPRRAAVMVGIGLALVVASHQVRGAYAAELLLTLGVECIVLSGLEVLLHRVQRRLAAWEEDKAAGCLHFMAIFDRLPVTQDDIPPVQFAVSMPSAERAGWTASANYGAYSAAAKLRRGDETIEALVNHNGGQTIRGSYRDDFRTAEWCFDRLGEIGLHELLAQADLLGDAWRKSGMTSSAI